MRKIFFRALLFIVVLYACFGFYFSMNFSPGTADEGVFIANLDFIEAYGWKAAIIKGISIPYMLLCYPLTLVTESYIALRLVNIILLIGLFVYFFFRNNPSYLFYIYFIFYVGTAKVFFIGTNDPLFIVGLVIFLNEVFLLTTKSSWNQSLALSALVISFFTRALIVVYSPVILLSFFLILKHKGLRRSGFRVPVLVTFLFCLVNLPSIQTNFSLSYDKKEPPSEFNVTWSQRQYLAQLMVNKGQLANYQHPSFQETQKYVDRNGLDSLPKSTIASLFFNPKLTATEFFKDLAYIFVYGSRQLSLILIIVIGGLLLGFRKKKINLAQNYVPLCLLIMILIFAAIIISFVELRWLVPVFILAIVYYSFLEQSQKLAQFLKQLNIITLVLLVFYGLLRLIPQL